MKKIYHIPLEENFIETFIHFFLSPVKKDYSNIAIIFPNKRPFLFLNKKLSERLNTSFIPSKNFTMDEFINYILEQKYPDSKKISSIDSIWIIYNILKEKKIKFSNFDSSFENFLPWGEKIFNFINQLDTENIDNKKLLSIEENADLGYNIPEEINNILKKIVSIRENFHNFLEKNRLVTRGYSYLQAMELVNSLEIKEFNKIYFAGLFALTKVEQEIINKLWRDGKAEIIWNGKPEDWQKILGKLKNKFKPDKIETLSVNSGLSSPKINLYSAFDTHSEVVKTLEILSSFDIKNTAVILPVADTLIPLLSLSVERLLKLNKIDALNISLQYPLMRTSLFSLIRRVLNIQKFVRNRSNGNYYNSKLYVDVISNPFIKNLSKGKFSIVRHFVNFIIKKIKEKNFTYIKLEDIETFPEMFDFSEENFNNLNVADIKKTIKEVHQILFENFENIETFKDVSEKIKNLLELIVENSAVKSYILSGEIFNLLYKKINEINELLFAKHKFDKEFIINFISSLLESESIPFSTTPLQELEIIGMLETRNLNFKNVIMLDVQDNILPGDKKIDPLIPAEIYKQLKLPDYEKQEEMNRFYFERIIKSAKNVHILYVEDVDKIKSRYVEKIIWDKQKEIKSLDAYKIDKMNFPIESINIGDNTLEIKKNELSRKKIKEISYSPSALDTYLHCGLKFYFTAILGLKEDEQISEKIDSLSRGDIVHKILEKTLKKAKEIKNYFTKDRIKEILSILEDSINETFSEKPNTGDFYILKKIVSLKLKRFIESDFGNLNFSIEELEKRYKSTFSIGEQTIAINGKIDRIDIVNNKYIIIDYKTGGPNYYKNIIKMIESDKNDINEINKNIKSIQLPFYIFLFTNEKKISIDDIEDVQYRFFDNNNTKIGLFEKNNKEEIYNYYKNIIEILLSDIFNFDKPFKKWENTDCTDCIFRSICYS